MIEGLGDPSLVRHNAPQVGQVHGAGCLGFSCVNSPGCCGALSELNL